jgi:hypothetical protein
MDVEEVNDLRSPHRKPLRVIRIVNARAIRIFGMEDRPAFLVRFFEFLLGQIVRPSILQIVNRLGCVLGASMTGFG